MGVRGVRGGGARPVELPLPRRGVAEGGDAYWRVAKAEWDGQHWMKLTLECGHVRRMSHRKFMHFRPGQPLLCVPCSDWWG